MQETPSAKTLSLHYTQLKKKTKKKQNKTQEEEKTHKPPRRAQRAGMHTLQHAMPHPIHLAHPLRRRRPPRQKHDPVRPPPRHDVNHLLRKLLPAAVGVAVGLVRAHRQARVEQQDAAVRPGGQQAAFFGRRFEGVGVFDLEELVDVGEGGGRWGRRADGEAEAVGLVEAVVGVLA